MTYLLDANVFIGAKRQHYGFDFCPAFWEWLLIAHGRGRVFSVQKVKDELCSPKREEDELSDWAKERGSDFFLPPSQEAVLELNRVSELVKGQGYTDSAVSDFFDAADYYLIGQALADDYTVVTYEVRADNPKKRVIIPNVCDSFNIECLSPPAMLRREGVRFVLEKRHD